MLTSTNSISLKTVELRHAYGKLFARSISSECEAGKGTDWPEDNYIDPRSPSEAVTVGEGPAVLGTAVWTGLPPAAGMALTAGAGMPAGPAGEQEQSNNLLQALRLLRQRPMQDRLACGSCAW